MRLNRSLALVVILAVLNLAVSAGLSTAETGPDPYCALYLPPHKITQRTIDEIVHYSKQTPVNAVVIHVKTPEGRLLWPSTNALATRLNVSSDHTRLDRHLAVLQKENIRAIAKMDVFADHQLAAAFPELSVMDRTAMVPWTDANGLHWSNPADCRVWEYNISLASELAHLGFDEIQFDYVRFPSDGDLSLIHYPQTSPDQSKSDAIAAFLEMAHAELKPLGVAISADIFGLTAWKKSDFGVGQVLEKMAPHLDVICPMFYPSHFPAGFLGKQSPGDFPELIMNASMRSMMRRTNKPIRPWIQGFWYRPDQIAAQMDGIEKASGISWSIWSPTGRYGLSYRAMADRSGTALTKPQFYPSAAELAHRSDQSTRGLQTVVNYTSFQGGYSIISLEAGAKNKRSRFASPVAVLGTLEEGIMDQILKRRAVPFPKDAETYTKRRLLSDLLCSDLGKNARRIRPQPIYIDWSGDCVFAVQGIPPARLDLYAAEIRQVSDEETAAVESQAVIEVASISEPVGAVDIDAMFNPPVSVFTQ